MNISEIFFKMIPGSFVRKEPREDKACGPEGFTLIELMVVILILGLLVGIVGFRFLGRAEDARITTASLQMKTFISALQLFRLDSGRYPTTEEGLNALVSQPGSGSASRNWQKGGYLEGGKVPPDPWGNLYVYISPGTGGRDYEIKSLGADGQEGGEGINADIEAWNTQ